MNKVPTEAEIEIYKGNNFQIYCVNFQCPNWELVDRYGCKKFGHGIIACKDYIPHVSTKVYPPIEEIIKDAEKTYPFYGKVFFSNEPHEELPEYFTYAKTSEEAEEIFKAWAFKKYSKMYFEFSEAYLVEKE